MNTNRIIILVLVLVLGVSVYQCQKKQTKIKESNNLQESLGDSLTFYRNKQGETVGRIQTLQGQNTSLFLSLSSKDSVINKLQNLVTTYKKELDKGGSAGVIYIEGETNTITKTVIDTVHGTYNSKFNLDNWVWGKIKAGKDSTEISISTREEVSFVIGQRKKGFLGFGGTEYFSDVKLANPYNKVKAYRTFDVDVPKDKWVLSVGAVSMYNINTGLITVGPGISFGYTILSW